MLQVVLKFKYNFWEKVVQEADFFGHVPQSRDGRGHCGLFYDLSRKVTALLLLFNFCETQLGLKVFFLVHQQIFASAIWEHQSKANHEIELEGVKILDKESMDIKRKIKEVMHIRRQHPTLDGDGGYELLVTFNHLLSCH